MPNVSPSIELVVNKFTGTLLNCHVLNDAGARIVEIPITEAIERYDPNGPGKISIELHTFRVKRTEE